MDREFYQWLQVIVLSLQLPQWPLEEKISRKEALLIVANFFGLDKDDPDLIEKAAFGLKQTLAGEEEMVASIPPRLKELVKEYEEHLEKRKNVSLASNFPTLDEQIKKLYENYRQQIQEEIQTLEPLVDNLPLVTVASEEIASKVIDQLPLVTPTKTFEEVVPLKRYEEIVAETTEKELKWIGAPIPPQETIVNLTRKTLPLAKELAASPPTATPITEALTTAFPGQDPNEVNQLYQSTQKKVLKEFQEAEILTDKPRQAEIASHRAALRITSQIPSLRIKEAFKEINYPEIVTEAISSELKQSGIKAPPPVTQAITQKTQPEAEKISITPHTVIPIEKVLGQPKPPVIPKEILPLPQEVATKLVETEGVAFLPVYTAFQPQAASDYVRKISTTPTAAILRTGSTDATPEWQEMVKKGIFVEDIETTIAKFKEAGLPEDHPIIVSLESKKNIFIERQKIRITRKDGTYFFQDKPAVKILKTYYRYSKRTGQFLAYDSQIGIYYQSSPSPYWSGKMGYSRGLRRVFNRLGQGTRLYKQVEIGPSKRVVQFVFGKARARIYQRTVGRVVSYTSQRLASTAVGKAVKAGVGRAATWVATKLGVEGGILATGVAGAGPTLGVSLAIAVAVDIAIKIGGKIIGKIWDRLKSAFREPEKALAWIGGGAIAAFLLPMPFALIAVVPMAAGGLGLLSWGVGSAGAIMGGLATGLTSFFTTLTVAPSTAKIGLVIGSIIGSVSLATFFITMTTAGAFILPTGPTEIVEEITPPASPPDVPAPPGLTFRWPVDNYFLCSSNFGWRILTLNGVTRCEYHEGIDIPAFAGSPVYSTAEGKVTAVGYSSGYGNYVVVQHNGLYSLYAHLLALGTYVGAEVGRSSVIGYVGNTGSSTGSHLHFAFSTCGSVPSCFINGALTPDPCNYVSCPTGCAFKDKASGCPGL